MHKCTVYSDWQYSNDSPPSLMIIDCNHPNTRPSNHLKYIYTSIFFFDLLHPYTARDYANKLLHLLERFHSRDSVMNDGRELDIVLGEEHQHLVVLVHGRAVPAPVEAGAALLLAHMQIHPAPQRRQIYTYTHSKHKLDANLHRGCHFLLT